MARRVVYLSDARYEGGAERYLLRLAGGLDRTRFEPVLCFPQDSVLDALARRAERQDTEVRRHPRGNFAGGRGAGGLLRALKEARPELVHMNLPSTYDLACGWAAPLARLAGAAGVVATEHIPNILPSRRRILFKSLASHWVDRVIVISKEHAAHLPKWHRVDPARIQLIYNGVEDPGMPSNRPGGALVILCVGTLEPRKGQDLLLEALAGLTARGADARLVLVGDGPSRASLENRVRELGLTARVRFTGRLDSTADEFRSAHVLAVPSRIEGLPFVVIEGMAAGAVVIASALPGMNEVITPGVDGLLLPPDRLETWIDTLARLARDDGECRRLAGAGRAAYEARFTLRRMVEETQRVYDEVLQ